LRRENLPDFDSQTFKKNRAAGQFTNKNPADFVNKTLPDPSDAGRFLRAGSFGKLT
jgi:hypothetical protein